MKHFWNDFKNVETFFYPGILVCKKIISLLVNRNKGVGVEFSLKNAEIYVLALEWSFMSLNLY